MLEALKILILSCSMGDMPYHSLKCQKLIIKCAVTNSALPPVAVVIKCIKRRKK